MIFGENSLAMDSGIVQESPYELGYGGALMHVWENEMNYNAIMKAVGISEMRYYNETGGDLLVQEAGAFSERSHGQALRRGGKHVPHHAGLAA